MNQFIKPLTILAVLGASAACASTPPRELLDARAAYARAAAGNSPQLTPAALHDARVALREDLYYRINVVRVHLPALRSRGNDILLMTQVFIDQFALRSGKPVRGVSSQAAEKLLAYAWPGNVRELQNCIERAIALTRHDELSVEDLPSTVADADRLLADPVPTVTAPPPLVSLDQFAHGYFLHVLRAVNGNRTIAAQVLGMNLRTLYRRLERCGEIRGVTRRDSRDEGPTMAHILAVEEHHAEDMKNLLDG